MSHFSIEKLNYEKDWGNLLKFFKKVYSPNHILTNKDFFEWQFIKSGWQNWLIKKDNEVVGQVGIIDPPFIISGKERRVGFWACLIILEELRNRGLGVFLSREIEKEMDASYSTGINAEGLRLFQGLGWIAAGNLYRWVRLPSFEKSETKAAEIKSFDKTWDESWKILGKRYQATVNRTGAYLNWRFIQHPRKDDYKIFGLRNFLGYDGYIVARLEDGDEYRAVRIVDFIAKDERAEVELLKASLHYAEERKANFVDFFCSSKMYAKSFESLDFAGPESKEAQETPVFILPLDNSRKYINWAYKIINPELKDLKKEDWFIVKADGDKDRPV